MSKVIQFINDLKKVSPLIIEYTFYEGYCYWLALILANRFKGDIWFNPDIVHFAAKIDDKLYDIYGQIDDKQSTHWMSWEDFQYQHQEAVESIVRSCIKKV